MAMTAGGAAGVHALPLTSLRCMLLVLLLVSLLVLLLVVFFITFFTAFFTALFIAFFAMPTVYGWRATNAMLRPEFLQCVTWQACRLHCQESARQCPAPCYC